MGGGGAVTKTMGLFALIGMELSSHGPDCVPDGRLGPASAVYPLGQERTQIQSIIETVGYWEHPVVRALANQEGNIEP